MSLSPIRKIIVFAALSIPLALTHSIASEKTAEQLASEGAAAFQAGQFSKSAEAYNTALALADISDLERGQYLAAKANALLELGWRTRQDVPLREAIDTFNKALEYQNAKDTPEDWGQTNSRLGDVYRSLAYGMYNNNMPEEGAKLYNQAIESFENALTVIKKGEHPSDWGQSQRALGQVYANSDTYLALSGKQSNATRLTKAISAFEAAMEIYTKEADPISWAGLQFQLGDVYATLHQRQSGQLWLSKSVDAHKKVLEVLKEADNPSVWAQVQYFIGNGLVQLGATQKDRQMLEDSIVASRLANESQYFKNIFPEFYERNLTNIKVAEGLLEKME